MYFLMRVIRLKRKKTRKFSNESNLYVESSEQFTAQDMNERPSIEFQQCYYIEP